MAASAPAFAQTTPTLTTLYSFDLYPDGANPQGNLALDANGNLFGTTPNGGGPDAAGNVYFAGTVFEIVRSQCTSSGCPITTLVSFDHSDGAYPVSGVILDANDNLYGTTTEGGQGGSGCSFGGCGTVFEVVNDGTASSPSYSSTANILWAFTGGSDGDDPIGGLTFDGAGNLLGTTNFGGNLADCQGNGCGTVFEIVNTSSNAGSPTYSTTATPTTLYSFTAGYDGANPAAGLLVDGAGNLLGTTQFGGGAYGTVFELPYVGTTGANGTSTGYATTPTTLASFPGGNNGATPQADLIADSNGNIFGTTVGNYLPSDGTVFEIPNNGTVSDPSYPTPAANTPTPPTTLYSYASSADSFLAPQAGQPSLIVDAKGDLFGTTYAGGSTSGLCFLTNGCGTIFEIVNNGTLSDPSYSAPTTLYTFTGGSDGQNPQGGLIADANGNLYGTTQGSYFSFGTVFELTNSGFVPFISPLQYEYAKLKIISGPTPGFDLQTAFETTGPSFDPASQPVTLTLGPSASPYYTVTIPPGNFQPLPNGRYAGAWVFSGTIGGVTVSVQIDPLGGDYYEFKANAFPVNLPTGLSTVNVFIQVGNSAGSPSTVQLSY